MAQAPLSNEIILGSPVSYDVSEKKVAVQDAHARVYAAENDIAERLLPSHVTGNPLGHFWPHIAKLNRNTSHRFDTISSALQDVGERSCRPGCLAIP